MKPQAPNPYRIMPPSRRLCQRAAAAGVDITDWAAVNAWHRQQLTGSAPDPSWKR